MARKHLGNSLKTTKKRKRKYVYTALGLQEWIKHKIQDCSLCISLYHYNKPPVIHLWSATCVHVKASFQSDMAKHGERGKLRRAHEAKRSLQQPKALSYDLHACAKLSILPIEP